ncbi:MAG TPA: MazG nucleotide pyrophosphohydrolase domain-containing protein [Candidatus Thermoplasmatota archaeon]|nr:MazG nucleotide pyrophosphohydrolase domain-containing protein [Candidatus Thermoplasmatota archaeon]
MDLRAIQARIEEKYGPGDQEMGVPFLCMVLMEEVGELSEAARKGDRENIGKEAVDVLFMALAIANRAGIDAEAQLRAKFLDRDLKEVAKTWDDVSWKRE